MYQSIVITVEKCWFFSSHWIVNIQESAREGTCDFSLRARYTLELSLKLKVASLAKWKELEPFPYMSLEWWSFDFPFSWINLGWNL